ncbi:unnamed protein product [Cladocopium goreaui]|uniref:Ubiquitin-like domain-containing protein n=1 Tax=Cladocopium goreaui TaxID=2562237 RepID=A0A9P1FJ93_9DINO|nr:unnamed protein product [Cladocopium goreaui]
MAKNISVELLSSKVCTLPVRPNMTIGELKEEVKDELTRRLSTVEPKCRLSSTSSRRLSVSAERLPLLVATCHPEICDSNRVWCVCWLQLIDEPDHPRVRKYYNGRGCIS